MSLSTECAAAFLSLGYGCSQTDMNDPGAQQPSQMLTGVDDDFLLTWAMARAQHRELRALLFTNTVWVFLTSHSYLQQLRVVRWDLRLIVLIREELKV